MLDRFSSCIGTTTVNVKVYDATDAELLNQDLKVKVKKNASDVTVTGIADGDKFSVGQTVDVTLPRAGVDTDERELTVDKAEIAEIKAGEKSRTYTVKFLKAGEATFTAKAYQSTKYPAATQSKAIKVTVGNPVPTGVKVVASNAFVLTFAEDVEALGLFKDVKEIKTDDIFYKINDTKISFSAVSAIKATGNTVKVSTYDDFASGETYYVTVNGAELSFVVSGTSPKDVVDIAILTDTITEDTETALTIALYNKDGIDIFHKVGIEYVTVSMTDYAKGSNDNEKLLILKAGDFVEVKAEYKYFDTTDNYKEITCSTTKKITATPKTVSATEGKIYTIAKTAGGNTLPNNFGANYTNTKNYIAIGDTGYVFCCYLKSKNNNVDTSIIVGKDDDGDGKMNLFNGKELYAKVAEEKIAIIKQNSDGAFEIVGNEVGSTNVFIGYDTDNGGFSVVDVCPIEVKAARKVATLKVTPKNTVLNTDHDTGNVVFELEAVDQYNDTYVEKPLSVTFTQNKQSINKYGAVQVLGATLTAGKGTYEVAYDEITKFDVDNKPTKSGSVNGTLKIDQTDLSTAPAVAINFSWADKTDLKSYSLEGAATIDTSLSGWVELKTTKIEVIAKDGSYVTSRSVPVTGFDKADGSSVNKSFVTVENTDVPKAGAVSGAGFIFAVRKDGSLIDIVNDGKYSPFFDTSTVATNGKIDVTPIAIAANAISKIPAGTYTFTLYEVKAGKPLAPQQVTVTVKDNQQSATFTQKNDTTASANKLAPTDAFKFYFGTTDVTASAHGWDIRENSSAGTEYVNSVKVNIPVNGKVGGVAMSGNDYFEVTVNVNRLIKIG